MKHKEKKEIERIKQLLRMGKVSYEEAKEMAEKPIVELNKKAEKIAKKYGRKFYKFNFVGLMR